MIGSALLIAMAIAMLVPVRMSDTPPEARGLIVVIATLLIAAACSMHLSTVIGGAASIAGPVRPLLVIGAWVTMFAGAVWAMSRAPGTELVVSMMTVPPLVGLAGVVFAPGGRRWHGAAFLGLAVGLALLVFPAWLERLRSA